MITWFDVQVVADLMIAAAYLTISLLIIVPLARAGHLRSNKLGAATAGIFLAAPSATACTPSICSAPARGMR